NYGEGGSGFGNEPLSLSSRHWAVKPNIQDNGQFAGVVVCELTVDRNGNVINVRPGVRGTTYTSATVNEMLQRELRKGKFNTIANAPDRRVVQERIEFKLRKIMQSYAEVIDYLYSRLPMFTRDGASAYKQDLDRTIAFCDALGNPQQKFKTLHVAGTNGKGSSSHMLAAVLASAGYKTGLYTSP